MFVLFAQGRKEGFVRLGSNTNGIPMYTVHNQDMQCCPFLFVVQQNSIHVHTHSIGG